MYNKNLRKERAAAGLCTNCGGTLDTDGRMCSACREKCRTKKTESVQWYRSNGICPLCKKVEIFSNENMCPECRAKYNSYQDARYWAKKDGIQRYERAAYGLCYICGKPLDREGKACKACSDKAAAVLSKNRASTNVNVYWKADNKLIFNKKLNVT